ncbi:SGNH hydrolase-type esterase domain-containing protein [Mycena rosella]|uniref:SGNH hydrolase-type esterase domain-containing protein n=1 Tax=Mycena rosella TaxID=1033263 RepID=A0AAD7G2L7_MYCRO|nr:SGNH hydrolase-type esterase domain-containing protein [Mycena rosella]
MTRSTLLVLTLFLASALVQSPIFGQCGGQGWPGPFRQPVRRDRINAFSSDPGIHTDQHHTYDKYDHGHANQLHPNLNIHLLPLGDSITYGFTSSDGNGYRSILHDLLQTGNTLDFIGSTKSGTMLDNDNKGHIAAIIEQIAQSATNPLALPARPNVVLLMAGTNDLLDGLNSTAPAALSALLDTIFTTCPDAALLVATLTPLPSTPAGVVDAFNLVRAQMVQARQAAGQHILLASMASFTATDLIDGIHPTDAGYVKMANV